MRFTASLGIPGRSISRGVTLVELIVAIAVLGVLTGIVAIGFSAHASGSRRATWQTTVGAARDSAIRSGRALTLIVIIDETPARLLALPDGRIIADSVLRIECLTGSASQ